jgi:hypothetical protein
MSGINLGDDVRFLLLFYSLTNDFALQKLIFESSEAVSVISTFDDLGLKEDLLRGIYAYSAPLLSFLRASRPLTCILHRL